MISAKMQDALNKQVNIEFYSAYIYLAMSAYCDLTGLRGFSHWMRMQHEEEIMHGNKIYDYILSHGGTVVLHAIDTPPVEYGSPLNVFEETLKHEELVTRAIYGLMDIAIAEHDYATQTFLQWFVTEQVEEEASVNEILDSLRMVGSDKRGLMMVDRELASRVASTDPVV